MTKGTRRVKYPDPNRNKRRCLIAIVVVVIVALTALLWRLSADERVVTFPYFVEGDKIEVTSLFQYSGPNPDCGEEAGEDIAALSVTNRSGKHVTQETLTLKLATGEKLVFEIQDLPANETAWVFASDNTSCAQDAQVTSLRSSARMESDDQLMSDKVAVSIEETTVTLTNLTSEDLPGLTVFCHTRFDDAFFGGLVYSYPVDNLPAGESVTIQAEDCYLGEAAVVRIAQES